MLSPVYLRFGRMAVPVFNDPENYHFELGKGIVLREGKDVTVVATGLMVAEAIEAGKLLEEKGIDARIINIHTIEPLDEELICKAAAETGKDHHRRRTFGYRWSGRRCLCSSL